MLSPLKRHPESVGGEALRVQADAVRGAAGVLSLRYVVGGPVSQVRAPPMGPPGRSDDLWRHTCFEAFVQAEDGAYYEFNLAPSRRWAAYAFSGYREGMTAVEQLVTPPIASRRGGGLFEVRATLYLEGLAGLHAEAPLRLALSAVLEDLDGGRSYWALAHPAGKPDFHHADSFALELP